MTKGKGKNPGAGNLDKHIKRTAHKERSQPASRKHLGALEKHKDYVKRAKRRHDKVSKLNKLKRAAAQRNPDEYHMKMTEAVMDVASGKMKRKNASKEERLKDTKLQLLKNSENINYLRHAAEHDRRRAKELLDEVVGLDMKPCNTHTVFVDDEEEVRRFKPAEYFGTTQEMLAYPAMRGKVEMMKNQVLPESLVQRSDALLTRAQKLKQRESFAGGDNDEADEDEEAQGTAPAAAVNEVDADDILGQRQLAHREERLKAASKMKEISQRFERSRSLGALAKEVERQNLGLNKNVNAKKINQFRRGANVRSR
ncbi:U3 snoRNA-associated protein UTP11, putative [Bodo saltans]|uniref:U3 snoRNA-associated protein UTP11, putative n=1 Tax=Bodo saltans TaxID=75058 RepID=A0A0S4INY9_BODSA|nr:U3 snoRNA-associated protein UTP11, putative [Bodo saltans]|eukprot:CUF74897.1 U3 snoRNA-associated protein UTP11, putative [Bodo saltans]